MILVIVGPTGIGKTKMSIELAKKYNAIIINGDAMQVYKELNIGTAKITQDDKEKIPHYLFDIVSVNDSYSVYNYQKDFRNIINKNLHKNIIIVGGSGLYLKAGLYNYIFNNITFKNEFANKTNEELYQLVIKKDPNTKIHLNNRKRLINFLNSQNNKSGNELLYQVTFIGLTTDRQSLYEIVNDRVDKMIENGLVEEVRELFNKNINSNVMKTAIGYKEFYKHFNNEINFEEAVELIKKNTRHYVKRQYTWFNNQMEIKWFEVDLIDFSNTIKEVINYIETLDIQ